LSRNTYTDWTVHLKTSLLLAINDKLSPLITQLTTSTSFIYCLPASFSRLF